ncbi:hypothetical protein [Neobacillus niacini]|uniref:hypothetical protein n=1 Tax=Neobacillus niacini TaxID=86668 RepID=UPI0021CB8EBF|nr:hypothetical protein [Neobacillus niacini]MCM3763909.1 hypothetical protein [Neobacillus niacini]
MWKKLLYGASKRFANDASRIVANEMKKKAQQDRRLTSFDDHSSEPERAIFLNRLRHILLNDQEMLTVLIDIINGLKTCVEPPFNDEGLFEYSQLILDINELAFEKNQEAHEIHEMGIQLSENTDDYTVEYKSLDVSLINAEIVDLADEIYNLLTAEETTYDIGLIEDLDGFIEKAQSYIEKSTEIYEELTKMNIVTIWDATRTRTIDYND